MAALRSFSGRTAATEKPLGSREFAALMAPFAPFEPRPVIAVAVSGGPDSMALALLAGEWAAKRKGRAVALTVDHRLRPESAREAKTVGRWLRKAGIAHRVLTWTGAKPRSGTQSAARDARYRLLGDWCRKNGVLHLLVAHTQDDQAETFLLRLERESGAGGLAAMPAVLEQRDLRLIRPLLTVAKPRLMATLLARKIEWIDDPSNQNVGFARVRIRQFLSTLAGSGFAASRLAETARAMGGARRALDAAVAALLARAATVDDAGFIELDLAMLKDAPAAIAIEAMTRCLLAVSGIVYPPRRERLERLWAAISAPSPRSRTLAGCRIIVRDRQLLICREEARAGAPPGLRPLKAMLWDGRFWIETRRVAKSLRLAPLGSEGWRRIVGIELRMRAGSIPMPARLSLPALWNKKNVVAIPHLGYRQAGLRRGIGFRRILWQPTNPLTKAGFSVA